MDLSYCSNSKVGISVPIKIEESIDKLNSSSAYYNDICYTTTSDSGTDIILNDRKTEFVEGNKTVCQDNCIFADYDNEIQKAKCSCDVIESSSSFENININKTKLYENFVNIRNIANVNLLKCYKVLFSKRGIIKNYGCLSLMPLLLIHFIIIILFYAKNSYKKIEEKIKDITYGIKNWDLVKEEEREKKRQERLKRMQKRKEQLKKLKEGKERKKKKKNKKEENDIYKKYNIEPPLYVQYRELMGLSNIAPPIYFQHKNYINQIDIKNESNPPIRKYKKNKGINIINNNNIINTLDINNHGKENESNVPDSVTRINRQNNSIKLKKNDIINLKKFGNDKIQFKKTKSKQNNDSSKQDLIEGLKVLEINKIKKGRLTLEEKLKIIKVLKFNDNELNEFGYKKAIKYDKRNFSKYYVSLLLTKHNLFQIFNNRDYNAYSIKVLLFFFNFSSCFAVNALFFNDNTMHQIYEDEGNFNFIYQLPQIAFSTLISYFIDNITTFLALSEDKVLELKRYKNLENLSEKGRKAKVTLKIKFIFFFFINLVLILLFWYYLSCFCAVYRNTQYHLIKDTLISFGIGSITPFGTNILTALLRIYSLKIYTNRNQMLFNLSKLFQQYL